MRSEGQLRARESGQMTHGEHVVVVFPYVDRGCSKAPTANTARARFFCNDLANMLGGVAVLIAGQGMRREVELYCELHAPLMSRRDLA